MSKPTLQEFNAIREAMFHDMTAARATTFWNEQGLPPPVDPSVPLAAAHKARLQWCGDFAIASETANENKDAAGASADGSAPGPSGPVRGTQGTGDNGLDATNRMLEESAQWLQARGYETSLKGAPPLTPERRDADRIALGKPLLRAT